MAIGTKLLTWPARPPKIRVAAPRKLPVSDAQSWQKPPHAMKDTATLTGVACVAAVVTSAAAFFYLRRKFSSEGHCPTSDRQATDGLPNDVPENVASLREQLSLASRSREDERKGRIRAERMLRELAKEQYAASGYMYKSIGICRSCFPHRNGTPRQPLLVPSGRAYIDLDKAVPPAALDSLDQFSHCWILFVFDQNTDMHSVTSKTTVRGKIRPPQLAGKKVGVFSTRSPHRPNNIGLSVAQIVNVSGRRVELRGIDLIDGTSVIDIKPYLPFDSIDPTDTSFKVPKWITDNANFAPMTVTFDPKVRKDLKSYVKSKRCVWWAEDEDELFLQTISDVLSLDIRSQNRGRGRSTGKDETYHCSIDHKNLYLTFVTLSSGIHVKDVGFAKSNGKIEH